MAYTVENMETALPSAMHQAQAELPVRSIDPRDKATLASPQVVPDEPKAGHTETPVEVDKAATPANPAESVTLSPKISALARKEQAVRRQEQALKQREADLADKLAKAEQFAKLQERLKSKDYSAAEELGMSYEEYSNYLLNKGTPDPKEERTSKIEQQLAELRKRQEDIETKEYQVNQNLWKQEISRIVAASEDFSTIKELGAEDVVLQHINDSFEEDGVELTAEQAAKEIEEALLERAKKFASVSKVKGGVQSPEPRTLGAPKPSSPKTITQNLTVTSQKPSTKPFHMMSESEQIQEAIRRVQAAKLNR
jgi:hypothetical protein